jgi:hypothetical protein
MDQVNWGFMGSVAFILQCTSGTRELPIGTSPKEKARRMPSRVKGCYKRRYTVKRKRKGPQRAAPFRTAVMLVTGQTYSHRKLGIAPSGRRQISRFRYGLRFEGHDVGRGPFQFPQQAPDEPFLAPVKAQPPTGINP